MVPSKLVVCTLTNGRMIVIAKLGSSHVITCRLYYLLHLCDTSILTYLCVRPAREDLPNGFHVCLKGTQKLKRRGGWKLAPALLPWFSGICLCRQGSHFPFTYNFGWCPYSLHKTTLPLKHLGWICTKCLPSASPTVWAFKCVCIGWACSQLHAGRSGMLLHKSTHCEHIPVSKLQKRSHPKPTPNRCQRRRALPCFNLSSWVVRAFMKEVRDPSHLPGAWTYSSLTCLQNMLITTPQVRHYWGLLLALLKLAPGTVKIQSYRRTSKKTVSQSLCGSVR